MLLAVDTRRTALLAEVIRRVNAVHRMASHCPRDPTPSHLALPGYTATPAPNQPAPHPVQAHPHPTPLRLEALLAASEKEGAPVLRPVTCLLLPATCFLLPTTRYPLQTTRCLCPASCVMFPAHHELPTVYHVLRNHIVIT